MGSCKLAARSSAIRISTIIGLTLCLGFARQLNAATATIALNAASVQKTFVPITTFGNNTAYWISATDNIAVSATVQAAGNYFLRYPGGSSSDMFHWNGTGSFDSNGYWIPSQTTCTSGFADYETYIGTSNPDDDILSNLDDGNTATAWLSNVDTDFPNHQWIEMDLTGGSNCCADSTTQVSGVTIVWGTPYATSFQIQYWTGSNGYPPPFMQSPESQWASLGTWTGTGGTQTVTFTATAMEHLRILLSSSSATTASSNGAYSVAEVTVTGPGGQVSVNKDTAAQTLCYVSSTDPASTKFYTASPPGSTDFASFMAYAQAMSPTAIPLITVNFGTGTPAEAAAWVYYANKVKNYGIKYWQIGNETEGDWEIGGPINTQDYVRRYIEYYNAMKAVDSTIVITGPVCGGMGDSSNLYDGNTAMQDFIAMAAAAGVSQTGSASYYINALDYHWYPNWGDYSAADALASTSTLNDYVTEIDSWLSAAGVTNPTSVPVIMSEYNVDAGTENFQLQLANGLWVADALGLFITDFGGRGSCNLWDTLNGGTGDDTSSSGGDLGYLNVANDGYQFQPRATYWAMKMMATLWAKSGDTQTNQLVSTTSNQTLLDAYTNLRSDGTLCLMAVNKDPSNSYVSSVQLSGFNPSSTAVLYTFSSANYAWEMTQLPYHANPDSAPTQTTLTVSTNFNYTFPPYSMTLIQFSPASPTPTPTATPTGIPASGASATATPTSANPGPLGIDKAVPFPSPWNGNGTGSLAVHLEGACDSVELKIYSRAMVCVGTRTTGSEPAGWIPVELPDTLERGAANGVYFYRIVARRGGMDTKPTIGPLVVLR
jgi:alpha-L-arabinofuranosidase